MEFLEKYPLILHTEFERWLKTKHTSMLSYILDKYWHNFMIYTYEYKSWCFDNFSRFIHHVPMLQYEKDEFLALDSNLAMDSKNDKATDSKHNKAEYFFRENALFFAKYTAKFPLTQNILIYNFPYKLLAQNLDFKTIKNIIRYIAKI
ncbi:hypothetical protein DCO58_12495 [Helicobacter saguini]|uniref:Uncharacterized protein n=1 Tax=Helicobacter saguini TaxID=1548018 RepID=A0A347VJV1_9HELI|nr:hypothetical protein [Helicobacter saguini]MWV60892.1 hypothetical protein [Helicobacter saguini]MWV68440.1 hypothetical protein [Helicobacter saguini]MWV70096.1 hypothetical protein [Helicobacter saguini]MWV71999.1 hypothetical protein [Helicobacter saguini]TLD91655.1 hypothetical protein LS64_011535 [Helicobacter saguini]